MQAYKENFALAWKMDPSGEGGVKQSKPASKRLLSPTFSHLSILDYRSGHKMIEWELRGETGKRQVIPS